MQPLYPKLLEADVLIMAAPIYFMAHCAQAKLLIDRCQVFWARRYRRNEQLRDTSKTRPRGVFISVGATHGSKVFAGAKITMKWFFDTLDMEYADNLLFEGFDEKGAIRSHPTALQEAYQLGCKLARGIEKTSEK
jgi:multimeric flavodoxin WrbA